MNIGIILGIAAVVLIIVVLILVIKNGNANSKNRDLEREVLNAKMEINQNVSNLGNQMAHGFGTVRTELGKDLGDARAEIGKDIHDEIGKTNEMLIQRIRELNEKVNGTLEENFKNTNKTFQSVIERLTVIDEAQKKMETVSTNIVSLQEILTDKKSRGIYGEVNLNIILANIFGEANKGPDGMKIYDIQHSLTGGVIADAVVNAPDPLGMICIDSKFPLENYRRMLDKSLTETDRINAERNFKIDVKKHIDAISDKYIINGVTADQAMMFVPAEAIFAELYAYHDDLIQYAQKKKVMITSPTTLVSSLSTILMVIRDMERNKYAREIQDNLKKLSVEFDRYRLRWDNLSKHIETVSKDVKEINTTTDKIANDFTKINNADRSYIIDNEGAEATLIEEQQ